MLSSIPTPSSATSQPLQNGQTLQWFLSLPYIAKHDMLISELNWDKDSEMSCHSFRQGLPELLAKKTINMEGLPESLWQWVKYTQTYHS
jgi:hypothetical protein